MSTRIRNWMSGKGLVGGASWTLLAVLIPIPLGIATIPALASAMGQQRLGFLTLSWALLGYFTLFDFGFAKSLTREVATLRDKPEFRDVNSLFWTASIGAASMGLLVTLLGCALLPWALDHLVRPDVHIRDECYRAGLWVLACLPMTLITGCVQGLCEGQGRFRQSAATRVAVQGITYAAPWLAILYAPTLPLVVASIVVGRSACCVAAYAWCIKSTKQLTWIPTWSLANAKRLWSQGAAMTVSSAISPVLVYADRVVVSAAVTLAGLSYYSVPMEAVQRLLVIPAAILSALFPLFASQSISRISKTQRLFGLGMVLAVSGSFPLALIVGAFAEKLLFVWLGADYAANSALIIRVALLGVIFNAVARVPFGLLQAFGRAGLTARIHIIEVPFFLIFVSWLAFNFGGLGAAIAWSGRMLIDMVAMTGMAMIHYPRLRPRLSRSLVVAACAVLTYAAAVAPWLEPWRLWTAIGGSIFIVLASVRVLLGQSERRLIASVVHILIRRVGFRGIADHA